MLITRGKTSSAATRAVRRICSAGDRLLPGPDIGAACLLVALVAHLVIHYTGLQTALASEGRLHRNAREASALHLPDRIRVIGEFQPLGVREELIAFVVTAFLVLLLTTCVRQLRSGSAAGTRRDALPGALWAVAVLALLRPRRVVDEIWRRSSSALGVSPGTAAPGSFALDVLWPVWILANLAMQLGDELSARATTIADLQRATWIEAAAELAFVTTAALLLCVTVVIKRRLERSDPEALRPEYSQRRRRVPLVAVAVATSLVLPVLIVDLAGAYVDAARGPGVADLKARLVVDRLWRVREQAAAMGNKAALRRVEGGPVLRTDLAGLSRQRRSGRHFRSARQLVGVRPVWTQRDRTELLAGVNFSGGETTRAEPASALIGLSRARPGARWHLVLEVPFEIWPLPWREMHAAADGPKPTEGYAGSILEAALFTATRDAEAQTRLVNVLSAPLVHGRTLVCGAAVQRGSSAKVAQACALGQRGHRKPLLLGRVAS
jgi:hypothetical protein